MTMMGVIEMSYLKSEALMCDFGTHIRMWQFTLGVNRVNDTIGSVGR
jgi:hypothetical protein